MFLDLTHVHKTYPDGTTAVRRVDLSVDRGQFVVLLGPSGCGKTTTLRMIAGLEIPSGGTILLDGQDVTRLRPAQRDVGFVFQFYALYPHLRVRDNIAFPLVSVGMASADIHPLVERVADRLGITPLLGFYPRQLSGGDQQRVSLARAMVRSPRLWLMDEPLGTLDTDQRHALRDFIRQRQLEQKVTTLYVTHDQEEAMTIADRIVVMRDGEVKQDATPQEVYESPADRFVATFVGSPGMNFIDGQIMNLAGRCHFAAGDGTVIDVAGIHAAGKATLGVRPEWFTLHPHGPIVGVVGVCEFLGTHQLLHLDTPLGRLCVRAAATHRASTGDVVRVGVDAGRACLFNPYGKRL
jgi:multiple sugar transport system ATP-binding protein